MDTIVEQDERIAAWRGSDNDPILDDLVRRRNEFESYADPIQRFADGHNLNPEILRLWMDQQALLLAMTALSERPDAGSNASAPPECVRRGAFNYSVKVRTKRDRNDRCP